jgi:hypothetical protein
VNRITAILLNTSSRPNGTATIGSGHAEVKEGCSTLRRYPPPPVMFPQTSMTRLMLTSALSPSVQHTTSAATGAS